MATRKAPAGKKAAAGKEVAENPFASDVTEPLPRATSFVIFGASGDLAARKLLPAVYNLSVAGLCPQRFRVVGVDLQEAKGGFAAGAREAISEHSRTGLDEKAFAELAKRLEFVQGDFGDPELFRELAEKLDEGDGDGVPAQRVFYLAVAPRFFAPLAKSLAAAGLGRGAEPPTKLVIEKPFGRDLDTALALNAEISSAFGEKQIFRIDHYLGKETVQNLQVLRFANGILEPIWNRRYVEHVQITMAEDIGIGHRAGYYDKSGAIRDVLQNHLLQLLALTTMEPPVRFAADTIRDEKVKVLRAARRYRPDEVSDYVVRGRYSKGWIGGEEVPGYLQEEGIPKGSRTETYVAMRIEIDNWRWAGTPFYLRTGKRLPRQVTEIAIQFRPVPHLPFSGHDPGDVEPNAMVLSVQPDEGVSLRLVAKIPGQGFSVRPVQMEFSYGTTFLSSSPEAYERLIHDVMIGDATLFTRADEVEAEWRIVDPVLEAWETAPPPERYASGSQGPKGADELLAIRGRKWRRL